MALVFDRLSACSAHLHRRLLCSYNVANVESGWDSDFSSTPAFEQLERGLRRFQADSTSYASLLQQCVLAKSLYHGRLLHSLLVKKGLDRDVFIKNHLIHMYGKCYALNEAHVLFTEMVRRNAVSWNIMIGLHAHVHVRGRQDTIELFAQMLAEGFLPGKVTFVNLLSSVICYESLFLGKCLHASIVSSDLELDVVVATAFISMYSFCGNLWKAWSVFDRMPVRDIMSWSAMISACAHHNEGEEALKLFAGMELQGMVPREITLVSCLSACASLAARSVGFAIHAQIARLGFDTNLVIGTALVDMYGKSGDLMHAEETFDKMLERSNLSWTAMMKTYAMHGQITQVVSLFEQMQAQGAVADNVSFLCALSACSHLGLLEECYILFWCMSHVYGLTPALEHYNCLIDLLGRLGRLCEGEILINNLPLPYEAKDSSWLSLLAACKLHSDSVRAARIASCVFRLDPGNAAPYLLLTSLVQRGYTDLLQ